MAFLSSSIVNWSVFFTSSELLVAGRKTGKAVLARSAPSAKAFATSIADRIPPEAMTVRWTDWTTSMRLAAVGIPQSQKFSPSLWRDSSLSLFARWYSTAAQLVPPAPATSIPATPAASSISASSAAMPAPVSLTITGTSSALAISPIFLSTPA